jgi:hypothetical protein
MVKRVLGMIPASVLAIGLASTVNAPAQEFVFPGAVIDDSPAGDAVVSGAFGINYTQPPPVTGIPGNRWNMLAGPSYVEGMPYAEATATPYDDPFVANPPAAAAPRARGRRNGRAVATVPPPYLTPLPITRLQGEGGLMPPVYAPFVRQRTYGAGYGMGPYGSNYYSNFWHGQPIIE